MDYIFYRIYQFYKKKDEIPTMTGIYFVFVVQLSVFLLLGIGFNFLSKGVFTSENLGKRTALVVAGVILGALFVLDVIWYGRKSKVKQIIEKYQDDTRNKKIKIWQIFMLPVFDGAFNCLRSIFIYVGK